MIRMPKVLAAWDTPEFNATLKHEIECLDANQLPLQKGLSVSSAVGATRHTVLILSTLDDQHIINAKAGIHYSGIIAGCSCADDPTPLNENPEYCVIQITIDKVTANTTITLLSE